MGACATSDALLLQVVVVRSEMSGMAAGVVGEGPNGLHLRSEARQGVEQGRETW